jgi:transcriptional regulator GlxA family with amidase domain
MNVQDMASKGNLSTSRVHRLFQEHIGTGPQRHVTNRRLNRASELLAHTALPVVEIALRVGYGDQAAFTRAFRKQAGATPSKFRASQSSTD